MTDMEVVLYLSKRALQLVKTGKAVLSSGGVRLADGTLFEMYKPVLMKAGKNASKGALRLATSVGNGMFALDPVSATAGVANAVMSYKNGIKLDHVIKGMGLLNSLGWATTALSAANIALNAAGFAVVCAKLNGLSKKIDDLAVDLKSEMHAIHMEDKILQIRELNNNLKSVVDHLGRAGLQEYDVLQIEQYLNEATELIRWLANTVVKLPAESCNKVFTLLFDLSSFFASVLKEYGTQFFYRYNAFPANYDYWMKAFQFIEEKEIKKCLKRTIWQAEPLAVTERLEQAFDFSVNVVKLQAYDLDKNKEIIPEIPAEVYANMSDFIQKQIDQNLVEEVDDTQFDTMREEILLQQNGYAAA